MELVPETDAVHPPKENGDSLEKELGDDIYDDDDENDTLEQSHCKASCDDSTREDESMRTAAQMDGSNKSHSRHHHEDSDSDSFVSCRHYEPENTANGNNLLGDSSDETGSDETGSEYSESMNFSSIRKELERGYNNNDRRPQRRAREGAPCAPEGSSRISFAETTKIPSPENVSPKRSPPLSRRKAGRRLSDTRLKAFAKFQNSLDSPPRSDFVDGSSSPFKRRPRHSLRVPRSERGTFLKKPPADDEGTKPLLRRSVTDDGTTRRRLMIRRAKTERWTSDDGENNNNNEAEDGRPKFKRRQLLRKSQSARSVRRNINKDDDDDDDARFSFQRHTHNNNRISVVVAFGHSREQSHYQPKVIRKCKRMDLQTGGQTHRDVLCQRIIDYPEAMNPAGRRRKTVMRTGNDVVKSQSVHGSYQEPQYRLQSRVNAQHRFHKEQMTTQSVQPGALTTYLIWSLRSNFVIVLLSEACAFWFLICVFAICIYAGAWYQPECLRFPNNLNFEESGSYFIDAWAVSWTTFSTVGYGMVYPQIRGEEHQTAYNCAFMTTLTALEAFVGVLFASFCGAVIVGKMTRAKSTASVRFSQRMILRFGTGVMHTSDDDDRCNDRGEKPVLEYEKQRSHHPCPVLEFRLANTLFGNVTGEIMNSKLSVVCSTLADDKDKTENGSTKGGTGRGSRLEVLKGMKQSASQFLRRPFGEAGSASESSSSWTSTNNIFLAARKAKNSNDLDGSSDNKAFTSFRNMLRSSSTGGSGRRRSNSTSDLFQKDIWKGNNSVFGRVSKVGKERLMRTASGEAPMADGLDEPAKHPRRGAIFMEEDPTSGLAQRKLFSSLKVEQNNHPFFKRVWTIRHVLNADSPLVSERLKMIIKASKGKWPAEACNHGFIRKNVDFQQLIVSLSGTTTGNKVFGLHVYEYRNLHVGYTFSPILSTAPDGRLVVDVDSIDNIQEQRGGGAEAVSYYEAARAGDDTSEPPGKRGILQRNEKMDSLDAPSSSNFDSNALLNLTTHSIDEVDESMLSSGRTSTVMRF